MEIWVLSGSYEGDQFASSHLTEKGACLAAISDVLQLLEVEDEEDARRVYNRDTRGIEEDKDVDPPDWDLEKMRGLPRDKLWGIFHEWGARTWDNQTGYSIEVIKTKLEA